ncbi:MAG: hypothetical protein M1817_005053 [Caeruleum heppii]|nr:MAG: hypothetical protein M1817_005053 [Caeruleum heppii]
MSASPPKEPDVEAGAQSADEEPMDRDPEQAHGLAYEFEVKEQDRWLPIANVARIMKTALPENAKIAKEAKECMQECVSEFISFITSEASEKCQQEKRKTVNGEDILFAMTSLGFENYAEALKIYLSKYRESARYSPLPPWAFGLSRRPPELARILSELLIDGRDETQSARGENQHQRSGSATFGGGGPVGGSTAPASNATTSSTTYHERAGSANHVLSPENVEMADQEGTYAYPAAMGAAHNGTAAPY